MSPVDKQGDKKKAEEEKENELDDEVFKVLGEGPLTSKALEITLHSSLNNR